MTANALIVGGVLIGVGSVLPIVSRLRIGLYCQMLGIAAIGIAGAAAFLSSRVVGATFSSSIKPALGVDSLSGFFLLTLAVVALPALLYATSSLPSQPAPRIIGSLTGFFLIALAGVIVARDVTTFLACWELMTVIPAATILLTHHERDARRSVYVYLAMTHLGGSGVWICMLVLAYVHGFASSAAILQHGHVAQIGIGIAALVGFGTKAGIMPFHSWLPKAHPLAPPHISALMSGMMIKVALYGLIRVTFSFDGNATIWLGVTLLVLGLVSSVGGVVYAILQHELKTLLAFSSIENVGIIVLGLGASVVLHAEGAPFWASIAFAAALLHTLNHAVFKALLFLGAGAFSQRVGQLDLDHLGGLLARMPWTAGTFLVGAAAVAGVPPLNGFASEWLTMQSLVHTAILTPIGTGFLAVLAATGLAVTAALALFCFVKVVGLTLLGEARTPKAALAFEVALPMRIAMVTLAGACAVLGVVPGLLIKHLVQLTTPPNRVVGGLGLSIPGTGSLPTPAIIIGLVLVVTVLVRLRSRRIAQAAPVWICGQEFDPSLYWNSASFTQPLRMVLDPVLRPKHTLERTNQGPIVISIKYLSYIPHHFDTSLYRPLLNAVLRGARSVRRLQSGSLRSYLAYLIAVLFSLLLAARLGLL